MTRSEAALRRDADFEQIEAAVMETARGRWFLAEFARRNRHADTEVLLAAVARVERGVSEQHQHAGLERFRTDLADMSAAIADARAEISSLPDPLRDHHAGLGEASHELDAITGTIETATTEILAATEAIQDVTWAMRESGVESALCDSIDEQATNIYTACSFQDLTAQRTGKVVMLLRFLEGRIHAMTEIWGLRAQDGGKAAPGAAPHRLSLEDDDERLSQNDIDFVLVEPANPPAARRGARPDKPATTPRTLADIDLLSDEEKASLFT
jgi:hypothetical protein